eukprot:CAMPEP_0185553386 /NCGR_PEP_ID=MMETSP1381-20130426/37699_1 /TAXON_ID=298111 /ORGANISM="Pavlova sp., Strain CCMP459" /LENGTH=415 /DNA_ID=CAMNT_0028166493 /DNA_START=83 /DNA_END=1326 /DNA_ORIENTATION=-
MRRGRDDERGGGDRGTRRMRSEPASCCSDYSLLASLVRYDGRGGHDVLPGRTACRRRGVRRAGLLLWKTDQSEDGRCLTTVHSNRGNAPSLLCSLPRTVLLCWSVLLPQPAEDKASPNGKQRALVPAAAVDAPVVGEVADGRVSSIERRHLIFLCARGVRLHVGPARLEAAKVVGKPEQDAGQGQLPPPGPGALEADALGGICHPRGELVGHLRRQAVSHESLAPQVGAARRCAYDACMHHWLIPSLPELVVLHLVEGVGLAPDHACLLVPDGRATLLEAQDGLGLRLARTHARDNVVDAERVVCVHPQGKVLCRTQARQVHTREDSEICVKVWVRSDPRVVHNGAIRDAIYPPALRDMSLQHSVPRTMVHCGSAAGGDGVVRQAAASWLVHCARDGRQLLLEAVEQRLHTVHAR